MRPADSIAVDRSRDFGGMLASRRRRLLAPLLIFSLLLHILVALLFFVSVGKPPSEPLPPPSVAMVFEGGAKTGASAPEPSPFMSSPSAPTPAAPDVPTASTPPPPAGPELAVPPTPPQPIVPPAETPPQPAPELPLPPPPPPPVPLLAPAPPAAVPMPPPTPVRPDEPRRPPPPPRPAPPRPREAAPSPPRNSSPLSNPLNFSFGNTGPRDDTPAEPRSSRPSPGSASRGLAMGPITRGGFEIAPVGRGRSTPGPDWRNALSAWIEAHKYYPEQAAANGEDGTVEVRVVVDRSGQVQSVQLEGRSGSQWLDLAAQALFRGARLPPFPPDMKDPDFTFDLTMHYILIRH